MANLPAKIRSALLARPDDWVARFLASSGSDVGREVRGAELHEAALSAAEGLRLRGLVDHPVLLAAPNSYEFLVGLLGALYGGVPVIPVPIPNRAIQLSRIAGIVEDCGARAILCSPESRGALEAHLEERTGGTRPDLVEVGELGAGTPPEEPRGFQAAPGDTVVVQYTSGSTRDPHGVLVTHANVLASAALQWDHWGHREATVLVNWMPNYHDMGLFGGFLIPLMNGGRIVVLRTLSVVKRPARWLQAISTHRGTISGAPPFAFSMCTERIVPEEIEGLDLSSWTIAFCGADTVPASVLASFRDRFEPLGLDRAAVLACYGLAEATIYAAGARPAEGEPPPLDGLDAQGVAPCLVPAAMSAAVRIVDPESGSFLPDGEEGEIRIAGEHVCVGYYGRSEESRVVFRSEVLGAPGRWLRTGDLGVLRGDRLFVTGRLKDVLVCNGMNVAAPDVEWLAASYHPALNPLAGATFPADPGGGDTAVLYLETHGPRDIIEEAEEVRGHIRSAVGRTFGVDLVEIHFVSRGTLERTSSGKIRRAAVATRHRSRGSRAGEWE